MQHRALQARVSVGMGCRQTLSLDGLQAEAKVRVQRRYGREHGRNMVATRLSNNTVRQRCKLGKVGMDVRRVCTCRSVIVTWLATGRTRHQIVISVPRRANIPVQHRTSRFLVPQPQTEVTEAFQTPFSCRSNPWPTSPTPVTQFASKYLQVQDAGTPIHGIPY